MARRRRYHLVVAALTAVLVVALPAASASADSISDAQARAATMAGQIAAGAARIRALTGSYDAASDQAVASASRLAEDQAGFDATQARVAAGRLLLERQLLGAYMDGGLGTDRLASGPLADLAVRREYLDMAAGNVTDSLDRLKADLLSLRSEQDDLRRSEAADQEAAAGVALARQAALAEATREQTVLDQAQGQLATMVAAALAAQAEQRAAAATARADRSRAPVVVAAPAPPSPQGLPVNGGVVAAVRLEVTPPPPVARAPTPPTATPVSGAGGVGGVGGVWAELRRCESGGNYAENTGNGYYGAYQFSQATWTAMGYPGRPDLEPPAMQDAAAQALQARSGWGQWPACSAALGL